MANQHADAVPQNTLSPTEVTTYTEVPAIPLMTSLPNTQVPHMPTSLPSWLSHSPLTYYQNLLGLIPPLATPTPAAGPSTSVPATIVTTNAPHAPLDAPLPFFTQYGTPTHSQPDYHAHYQAQFQAITSQLAAIQQTQIQLAQLVNSQTNRQNTQPVDRPNQQVANAPNSDLQERRVTTDRPTRPSAVESSCSTPNQRQTTRGASYHNSSRHPTASTSDLAQQVAALKQEIKNLKEPRRDNWEWLSEEHNPLSPSIRQVQVPQKVKLSPDTYDGKTDPADHLNHFRAFHNLRDVPDAIQCRIFPTTLRGPARTWWYSLNPGSITNFDQLGRHFLAHFSSCRTAARTSASLMAIKQHNDETIRDYLKRFNAAALEVRDLNDEWAIQAFTTGVRHQYLKYALTDAQPTKLYQLYEKAQKYAEAEEIEIASRRTDTWDREQRTSRGPRPSRFTDRPNNRPQKEMSTATSQ